MFFTNERESLLDMQTYTSLHKIYIYFSILLNLLLFITSINLFITKIDSCKTIEKNKREEKPRNAAFAFMSPVLPFFRSDFAEAHRRHKRYSNRGNFAQAFPRSGHEQTLDTLVRAYGSTNGTSFRGDDVSLG